MSTFRIVYFNILGIKSKEVGDVTLHFVKSKIVYDYNYKVKGVISNRKEKCYRWMATVIEEDGFGKMLVDDSRSKNKFIITMNGKLQPGEEKAGDDFLK